MRAALTAIFFLTSVATAEQPPSWTGQLVFPKKAANETTFGDRFENGTQVKYQYSGKSPLRVINESGDWIRFNDGAREGWALKSEFVLQNEAMKYFIDRLSNDPRNLQLLATQAEVARHLGEYKVALECYDSILRLDPTMDHMAREGRGMVLVFQGQYDAALKELDSAVQSSPRCGVSHGYRGRALAGRRDFERAIRDFDRSIELDPAGAHMAYEHRGLVRAELKEFDKAVADLTQAIKLDSYCGDAYLYRAMVHVGRGKHREAAADFEAAIRHKPSPYALQTYATFLAGCPDETYRNGQKAVKYAREAIEKAGKETTWEQRATLAAALAEAGEFADAVREQRAVLTDKTLTKDESLRHLSRLELFAGKRKYRIGEQDPMTRPYSQAYPQRMSGSSESGSTTDYVVIKDATLELLPMDDPGLSGVGGTNLLYYAAGGERPPEKVVVAKGTAARVVDQATGVKGDRSDAVYKVVNGRANEVEIDRSGKAPTYYKVTVADGTHAGKSGWVPVGLLEAPSTVTYKFSVGSVSWISILNLPDPSELSLLNFTTDWSACVALGLFMTRNPSPPNIIHNIKDILTRKQYRGAMWADITVVVDAKSDRVIKCTITNDLLDPGWTPPPDTFGVSKIAAEVERIRKWVLNDTDYHAGEMGSISRFAVQKRHPNSNITIAGKEELVVEGLIRFRAGADTDNSGTSLLVGSPYHVPWVWNNLAVTYVANGQFKLYIQGSAFPSHKWYIDGKAVACSVQKKVEASDKEVAFTTGESAKRPQTPVNDEPSGAIEKAPFTMPAGKLQIIEFSPKAARESQK